MTEIFGNLTNLTFPMVIMWAIGAVMIYLAIIKEMERRGFIYYDWNVSCGDAASVHVSPSRIVDNVLSYGKNMKRKIVLMHDGTGHSSTADALPAIIE